MSALRSLPWPVWALAFAFATLPMFPAFITLAAVTPPGVSLVPRKAAIVLLAICALLAVLVTLRLVRERAPLPATFRALSAYIGGWLVAALFGLDPKTSLLFVADGLLVLIFHWGISRYYREPNAPAVVLAAFLGSGALVSLLGLLMVAIRRPAVLYAVEHGRATATFVVPGEFAGYLLFLIPVAAGVTLASRRSWLRVLGMFAASLGALALAATYSRAGWLGFIAGAAFWALMARRSARTSIAVLGLLFAGALAAVAFSGHHNPSEYFTRVAIWLTSLRAIELFPLTGVGPGCFRLVYPALRPPGAEATAFHAHSYLLTSFAETGVVGMATLIVMWWSFAQRLSDGLRRAQGATRTFSLALAAGFVATWAQGTIDFVQVVILGCWIPFMALALQATERGLGEA